MAGAASGGSLYAIIGAIVGPILESGLSKAPTTKMATARVMSDLAVALRKGDAAAIERHLRKLRYMTAATQVERQQVPSEIR